MFSQYYGCPILQDTHFPLHHFGYNNNIGKTFSSDQKKPWQRSGESLSSKQKLSSVLEKINLKHIVKQNEKHPCSNWRLVSNLGFISKVVEKVTLTQFIKHCNKNRLLPTYQSAYMRNHNYETSLVKLVDDILWGMEDQLVTSVVILDLLVAFDTVDHNLLLDVLEKRFGVTDNTNNGTITT